MTLNKEWRKFFFSFNTAGEKSVGVFNFSLFFRSPIILMFVFCNTINRILLNRLIDVGDFIFVVFK